jgi:signal transduction histidine kinase
VSLPFTPRRRTERLIAGGRIVLAATSTLVLWRVPSEPAKYAAIAYSLLAAYFGYAVVLAALAWRGRAERELAGWISHGIDLVFFSTFIYFTSGPASPFIAYFVFALVCATLRWQWRGTLWTAVVSLAVFFGLGYYFAEILRDPAFEIDDFVIRGVYMGVVAFLLGHLGWYLQRNRREMALLAEWPSRETDDAPGSIGPVLGQIAAVHDSDRVALAWRMTAAESSTFASRIAGVTERRSIPEDPEDLVRSDLRDSGFVAQPNAGRDDDVLVRREGLLERRRGDPLAPALRTVLGPGTTLSAPWKGELAAGRVFIAGVRRPTSDDLRLAEIVGALAGARVDRSLLLARMRHGAAAEERARLARDLHDGVLQSLTGIGLRVAAARRQLAESPADADRSLSELQRLLTVEQRDLRFFISDLEPPADQQRAFDLAARLADLVRRAQSEWQLEIDLATSLADDELPDQTERDLYFIVREALVNAVRHGGARRIRLNLRRLEDRRVGIAIEDDGRGFPFRGRFDLESLSREGLGPRSLRDRVATRSGTLCLASSDAGARIDIELPVPGGADA